MARARTYKAEGVVLRQAPIGEADRILTLYTREMGKLRCVARGVRRTKSRLGGHLEPLTHVLVSLAEGRTLDVITEAQTLQSFRGLSEDLQRVSKGVYLSELVDTFSVENSPNLAVFDLYLNTLGGLQGAESPSQLMRYFEIALLGQSGFGPELHRCVDCRSVLEPGDHLFSCLKGGILCAECRVLPGEALLPLSLNSVKVLRYLQREDYGSVSRLRVPLVYLREVERLLTTYVRHVLERELKSAEFMNLVSTGT